MAIYLADVVIKQNHSVTLWHYSRYQDLWNWQRYGLKAPGYRCQGEWRGPSWLVLLRIINTALDSILSAWTCKKWEEGGLRKKVWESTFRYHRWLECLTFFILKEVIPRIQYGWVRRSFPWLCMIQYYRSLTWYTQNTIYWINSPLLIGRVNHHDQLNT